MLISTAVLNEAHLKITSLFEIPTQHYLSIVRYAVRSTAGVAQPDIQSTYNQPSIPQSIFREYDARIKGLSG